MIRLRETIRSHLLNNDEKNHNSKYKTKGLKGTNHLLQALNSL